MQNGVMGRAQPFMRVVGGPETVVVLLRERNEMVSLGDRLELAAHEAGASSAWHERQSGRCNPGALASRIFAAHLPTDVCERRGEHGPHTGVLQPSPRHPCVEILLVLKRKLIRDRSLDPINEIHNSTSC